MPTPSWVRRMKRMISREHLHSSTLASSKSLANDDTPWATDRRTSDAHANGVPTITVTTAAQIGFNSPVEAHEGQGAGTVLPVVPSPPSIPAVNGSGIPKEIDPIQTSEAPEAEWQPSLLDDVKQGVSQVLTPSVLTSIVAIEGLTPSSSSQPDPALGQLWQTMKDNKEAALASVKLVSSAVGGVNAISSAVTNVQTVANEISTNLAGTAIASGFQAFVDNIPLFMKGLDELAKIHPFVGVAVIAFKAVYLVGEKYVENDRNVKALREEMRSLMEVLLRLKGLRREQVVGPDGTTIDAKLQSLIQKTVTDIQKCGNTIETYQQQRLVVKITLSISWAARFTALAAGFTTRRGEFEQELVIHTAVSVDGIDAKVTDMRASLERLTLETSERMMKMFEQRMSANQQQILAYMQDRGGVDAFKDEATMKVLIEQRPTWADPEMRLDSGRPRKDKEADGDDRAKKVLADLKTTIEAAEEKNMERFSQRLQVRMDRLESDMKEEFARQSDRIIGAIMEGPYQRIQDEDIRAIWKEMQWKGNVKARHFILALKDYYHEQMEKARDSGVPHDPTDDWTSPYINVPYLQPILEAFDDDASGFITISEVKKFVEARPDSWSLRHWIAYWAVGWFKAASEQAKEIDAIFAEMFGLVARVLPTNSLGAMGYLETIWWLLYDVIRPLITRNPASDVPYDRFSRYVEQEQDRLEANLKTVNYLIDREEMVFDITGQGRIEKFFIPLVLLLLRRHLELFREACVRPLPENELYNAAESFLFVWNVLYDRYQDLQLTFTQQRQDLKQQFRTFAYGVFRYFQETNELWTGGLIKKAEFDEVIPAEWPTPLVDVEAMLDFAFETEKAPSPTGYSSSVLLNGNEHPELSDKDESGRWISQLLGTWYCTVEFEPTTDAREVFMRRMDWEASTSEDEHQFNCSAISYSGRPFAVSGSCHCPGDNLPLTVTFTVTYESDIGAPSHYVGQYDAERQAITGTCGFEADPVAHNGTFNMMRSADRLRSWPSPTELKANKWRAMWQYAINVVSSNIRNRCSWDYIQWRQQYSQKWMEWHIRRDVRFEKLADGDEREYNSSARSAQFLDLCMFTYRRWKRNSFERRQKSWHFCDNCREPCDIPRIICLECDSTTNPFSTIDLCGNKPDCEGATVDTNARTDLPAPHLPTHDLIKIRRVVLERRWPSVFRVAQTAMAAAKDILKNHNPPVEAPIASMGPVAEGSGELTTETALEALDASSASLQCLKCKEPISLPCWYCAECEAQTFICYACDAQSKGRGIEVDGHQHWNKHVLVKCQVPAAEQPVVTMEMKVSNLEQNMQTISDSVLGVREHLRAVDDRIGRLEELLKTILAHTVRDTV